VDEIYPIVDEIYPIVDEIYPIVDEIYPIVDEIYRLWMRSTRLWMRSSRLSCSQRPPLSVSLATASICALIPKRLPKINKWTLAMNKKKLVPV
jgi:hypothetical protein